MKASFEDEASTILRRVAQRIDQHDAHLTGLSALTAIAPAPSADALAAVAGNIIQFYPRIRAIDVVDLAQSPEGPPVFTSRATADSVPYDTIERSLRTTTQRVAIAVPPGVHGRYLMVKRVPTSGVPRFALALDIDAARLLETLGTETISVTLLMSLEQQELFVPPPAKAVSAHDWLRLSSRMALSSDSQPLTLIVRREVTPAQIFPAASIGLFGAVAAGLLWLLRGTLTARQIEFAAVQQAKVSAQEARLAHASRINAMGELSLGIAHELTQPLAAMLSQSQAGLRLIKACPPDNEAITRVLEANARHARRAGDVLQKLREWVSLEPPSDDVADLNQVAREIASLNRSDLERRGIMLHLHLSEPATIARVDRVSAEQITQNLVTNARDACDLAQPPGRSITIETCVRQQSALLMVRDDGCGIGSDVAGRLFEPFVSSKPDGTGLGLSISRRLAERHNGTLDVSDVVDRGRGSAFTVTLPAVLPVDDSE